VVMAMLVGGVPWGCDFLVIYYGSRRRRIVDCGASCTVAHRTTDANNNCISETLDVFKTMYGHHWFGVLILDRCQINRSLRRCSSRCARSAVLFPHLFFALSSISAPPLSLTPFDSKVSRRIQAPRRNVFKTPYGHLILDRCQIGEMEKMTRDRRYSGDMLSAY
jgi:hypothetical protein